MCAHYATILGKMYMHTLARFCESQRRFSLFSPLNITYFFSALSAPCCCRPCLPVPVACSVRVPLSSLRLSSAPAVCCAFRGCCVSPSVYPSPWLPCVCLLRVRAPEALPAAFCVSCRVSSGSCRHSSAIRRKTVWQCGQMHRVYVPGLISSCPCAAVPCPAACSVASCRPSVCVCCCRVSSGGNNSLYASISRAAAMRCSVCNVMLLLSIWI